MLKTFARRVVASLFRNVTTELTNALDHRSSPATKIALREHAQRWADAARRGPLDLRDAGFRVFSQTDDDGIILAIFAAIGTTNRVFVDIGSSDGILSNCANLAVNLGWRGLMIDGHAPTIARGKAWYQRHPDTITYPPTMISAMVTRENINDLIREAGFSGEIDFLSLDIDGNDYWVWEALTVVQPRVVVVEANPQMEDRPLTIPYDPNFVHMANGRPWAYQGAGAEAFRRLARRKGYRLVAGNNYGFNFFFVRDGIGEAALPAVTVNSLRTHPYASGSMRDTPELPMVTVPE